MNQKFLSVLFSALLCSTLGHEYQRAHELSRHHNTRHHVGRSHFRALDSNSCSYVCPVPAPASYTSRDVLTLVNVFESNVFGLFNETANVGMFFQNNLVLLINGNTQVVVLFNLETETGVYFAQGANKNCFDQSKTDIISYLKSIGSLSVILKWENGQTFQLKSTPKTVTTELVIISRYINTAVSQRAEINPQGITSIIVALARTLISSKDVTILLFSKLETKTSATLIHSGTFISTIYGLSILNKKLSGGLSSLITSDFRLSLLFSASSGLEILIYLLQQAGGKIQLSKVLGDISKSPDALMEIAVLLSLGHYGGIRGIAATIQSIQLYAAKKISLEALIDVLIQVGASNNIKITRDDWQNVIKNLIAVIKVQIDTYKENDLYASMSKFLNDASNGNLVIGGINVSAIINILIDSSTSAKQTSGNASLTSLIKVLLELKVVVSVTTVLATLYVRLIWFIVSGQGVAFILDLLPDVKISIDFSSTTSIIKQLLSSIQVTKIMQYVITLDVVGVITHLPVFGDVFQAVDGALKLTGSAVQYTLSAALKDTGSILTTIKNWIWGAFGLSGGSNVGSGGIAGLGILGGGAEVTSTFTWTLSGGSSSSGSGSGGSTGSNGGSGSGGTTGSNGGSGSGGSTGSNGGSGSDWTWTWGGNGASGGSSSGSGSTNGGTSGSGGNSGASGGSGTSVSGGGSSGNNGGASGSSGGSTGNSGNSGWSWSWGGNSGSENAGSSGSGGQSSGSGGQSGGSGGQSGGSGGQSGGSGGQSGGSGSSNSGGGLSWGWGSQGAGSSGNSGSGSTTKSSGGSGSNNGGSGLSWGWGSQGAAGSSGNSGSGSTTKSSGGSNNGGSGLSWNWGYGGGK